jgi:hypothetical protein
LELLQRLRRRRPEDPVDPPAVEAEAPQQRLQLSDIVAPQERRHQSERTITEAP